MGTKLTELRSGCFHAALDDEPMFVLLARDPKAPDIVDEWADKRDREINAGVRPSSDRDKVNEARETAQKMRDWRADNDGAWRTGLFGDAQPPAPHVSALEGAARAAGADVVNVGHRALACIHGFSNHGEYCPTCNDGMRNYEPHR